MMWRKAMLFDDGEGARAILAASHPRQAKQFGRSIRGFDQRVWDGKRFGIVVDGSVAKFRQHDELRRFLLTTGKRVLVEASPADASPYATNPERWRGLNLLGFALARARDILRATPAASRD
ncbi:MAG: hypothetical protein JWQ81_4294 [Amycolatopsis sp.]|nr:hypothetical protein [Amycolatopsis sp.]